MASIKSEHLTIYVYLGPIIILQFGLAFIFPNCAARTMQIFPDQAGKAAAIFGCSIFLGGTIVSAVMSLLPENSLLSLAVVYSIILSIMYCAYRVQISKQLTQGYPANE